MGFHSSMLSLLTSIRDAYTGSARIGVPAHTFLLGATGAPLAVFADNAGASAPGVQLLASEGFVARWNNHATQATIGRAFDLPDDIDVAYPIGVDFEVCKSGTTDAPTITFSAFIVKSGQLINADADCGGVTGALPAATAANTLATLTRDIAAADVAASLGSGGPGTLHLAFSPTSGTLGSDDFMCAKVVLRYRRRAA